MHWLLIVFITVVAIGFTFLLCVWLYYLCCYNDVDFNDEKEWRKSKTSSSSRTVVKDEYGWSSTYTSLPNSVIVEQESEFTTIPLESKQASSLGFVYPEQTSNRREINAVCSSVNTPAYSTNQLPYPHESSDGAEVSYYVPAVSSTSKRATSSTYSAVGANASPPYPPDHNISTGPPPVSLGFHPVVVPECSTGYSSITTRYTTSYPESSHRNGSYMQSQAHFTYINPTASEQTRGVHNPAQRYPSRVSLYDNA